MQNNVGKVVRTLMRQVRQTHFARPGPRPDSRRPVVYWEETSLGGIPYMVPLVILRTRPCRWFSAGGCVMCNYELLAIDEGVVAPLGQFQIPAAYSAKLSGILPAPVTVFWNLKKADK